MITVRIDRGGFLHPPSTFASERVDSSGSRHVPVDGLATSLMFFRACCDGDAGRGEYVLLTPPANEQIVALVAQLFREGTFIWSTGGTSRCIDVATSAKARPENVAAVVATFAVQFGWEEESPPLVVNFEGRSMRVSPVYADGVWRSTVEAKE